MDASQYSTNQREQLFILLKQLSFRHGEFVLASGRKASYYMDCRMTTLSAEGSYLIGQLVFAYLDAYNIDAVGGMSMGADPIVSAVTYCSAQQGRPIQGFLIRKEAKAHGTRRAVEGHLEPWMRVAMVEDVITTGGSLLKAVQLVKQSYPSVQIVKALTLVDREEGGKAAIEAEGISLESLFQVSKFL
ncbi:MAG: orotate phosphoribosyltransferase [Cyanobacteria bacterium]|nr:orotate phosphoribosyltransferase [Cyanobacteriota bacterium]